MNEQSQKTILVIEDDPEVLSMIIKHLEHAGHRVMTAKDGMEGLKKIESGGYDLVVTDIVMPYVSGVGLVTAIKQKTPNVPVIAITGFGREPEAAATEKEADIVLAKPFRMTALKERIAELLDRFEK